MSLDSDLKTDLLPVYMATLAALPNVCSKSVGADELEGRLEKPSDLWLRRALMKTI